MLYTQSSAPLNSLQQHWPLNGVLALSGWVCWTILLPVQRCGHRALLRNHRSFKLSINLCSAWPKVTCSCTAVAPTHWGIHCHRSVVCVFSIKQALNLERWEIIVFSALSTDMDKCTWCLLLTLWGFGTLPKGTSAVLHHLSCCQPSVLFCGGLLGLQIKILCVWSSNTFWVWKYFTITVKGQKNLQPQKTQSLNYMCVKPDTSCLKAAGTGSSPSTPPSNGWSGRRWMGGCIKQASKVNLNVKVLILGALIRNSTHQRLLIRTATMGLVYLSTHSHEEAAVKEWMTHTPSGALLCELAGQSQQMHSPALSHAPAAQPEFHVFTSSNCLIVCNV